MILVTGATGLLGGHLIYALLQQNGRVAALKRPSAKTDTLREIFSFYTKDVDSLMARIDWRTGDLLDKDSLIQALDGITCIINCAAIVSFDPRDRRRMVENNVQGVRNLVEAMQERQNTVGTHTCVLSTITLIHISSISALGDGPGDNTRFLIDENTPRNPKRKHSGYSISKYESEQVIMNSGIPAVILNPGVILGPGQWDKGSSVLFEQARKGMKYFPYGGTGYVDVRDVAEVVIRFVRTCPEEAREDTRVEREDTWVLPYENPMVGRYCLVGANLRYREFFNMVTDELGLPNPTIYAGRYMTGIAWRADAVRSFFLRRKPLLTSETAASSQRIAFYSSEKVKETLGFEFRPIEETIEWVAGFRRDA